MKRLLSRAIALLWLLGLGASAVAEPESPDLFFDEALSRIVQRSTAVGSQREQLGITQARNLPQQLILLPTLTARATQASKGADGGSENQRGAQGDLDLNLFHFGADVAAMRAAAAEERARRVSIDAAILELEDRGARALIAVIQSEMEIRVLRQILRIRQESQRIAMERYQRGLLASQEVDKLTVDLGNEESGLKDAQMRAASARGNLEALLGHSRVRLEWPWPERLAGLARALTAVSAPDLSQRPDWKAAELQVEAAGELVQQSWGRILPSLDLHFSYGYYQQSSSLFPSPPPGTRWTGSVTLTIPLFDRLANYGEYRAQIHLKGLAELKLEKTRRSARSEWSVARDNLQTALQTATSRDQILALSRRVYQDNHSRFRKGLIDANELGIDQERSFKAELFAVRGWGTAYANFSALCHALGRTLERCQSR